MCSNLKEILPIEQKKILVEMLKYIDDICRKNKIKYSLTGGTAIGAVRHKGFIPWDDDIDIILDRDNYFKLIEVLENNNNDDYKVLIPGKSENYPLQFAKLVNKKTLVVEYGIPKELKNYGLFVDIFYYNYMTNNMGKNKKFYKKLTFLRKSLYKTSLQNNSLSFAHKTVRFLKNTYLSIFGYKRVLNEILKMFDSCPKDYTDYVLSNNPGYRFEQELQNTENILNYTDIEFEGQKVMIFKNYHEILKTSFGDYMKLPPKEKRNSHNLKAYWREYNEKAKK